MLTTRVGFALAARHRLPEVYYDRCFAAAGDLISYGSSNVEEYRFAACYIDRILTSEQPAESPIEQATEVSLNINLKTAKALGLVIPEALLARANEAAMTRSPTPIPVR